MKNLIRNETALAKENLAMRRRRPGAPLACSPKPPARQLTLMSYNFRDDKSLCCYSRGDSFGDSIPLFRLDSLRIRR